MMVLTKALFLPHLSCIAYVSFRIKISGEIPSLQLQMSDLKLRNILGLVESIPLPTVTEEEKQVEIAVRQLSFDF